jgi:hypothetical protein
MVKQKTLGSAFLAQAYRPTAGQPACGLSNGLRQITAFLQQSDVMIEASANRLSGARLPRNQRGLAKSKGRVFSFRNGSMETTSAGQTGMGLGKTERVS